MDDGLRVVVVGEARAGAHDDRPDLADNLSSGGNINCIGDNVGSRVEEDDLAACELADDGLDSSRIIGVSVTLKTII